MIPSSEPKVPFKILEGKIFYKIEKSFNKKNPHNDFIEFHINNNEYYIMFHEQVCCESVNIEDICGELDWLVNTPILLARESISEDVYNQDGHQTWTFYELSTINGSVTIRWFGTSNGYYSESVDLYHVKKDRYE